MKVWPYNRLYKILLETSQPTSLLTALADATWLWHAKLGHVNFRCSKRCLLQNQQDYRSQLKPVFVLSDHYSWFVQFCVARSPHHQLLVIKYFLLLVDDYSRWMSMYMLKENGEALCAFKKFKRFVENESDHKLKTLRTDWGGEFLSQNFSKFCEEEVVKRQLIAPYTPQQNCVMEWRNRTIMNTARSLL